MSNKAQKLEAARYLRDLAERLLEYPTDHYKEAYEALLAEAAEEEAEPAPPADRPGPGAPTMLCGSYQYGRSGKPGGTFCELTNGHEGDHRYPPSAPGAPDIPALIERAEHFQARSVHKPGEMVGLFNELLDALTALSASHEALKQEHNLLIGERNRLRADQAALGASYQALKQERDKWERETLAAEERLLEKAKQIGSLNHDLEAAEAQVAALTAELENIANAKPSTWEADVRDQFQPWAQNRARDAIAKLGAERPRPEPETKETK